MADETVMVENSSNVVSYAYSRSKSMLTVEFKGGATYEYKGVPELVFEQMKLAESKGSFVSNRLKGYYEFGRVK